MNTCDSEKHKARVSPEVTGWVKAFHDTFPSKGLWSPTGWHRTACPHLSTHKTGCLKGWWVLGQGRRALASILVPSWMGQNSPKAWNAETASQLTSPSDGIGAEWGSFLTPMPVWAGNQRMGTSQPSPAHWASYLPTLTLSFFTLKWVGSRGYSCLSWALSDFKAQCNILPSVFKEGSAQKLPLEWVLASATRHSEQLPSMAISSPHSPTHSSLFLFPQWNLMVVNLTRILLLTRVCFYTS